LPPFRFSPSLLAVLLAGAGARAQAPDETLEVTGSRPAASAQAPAAQATVIEAAQFAGEVRSVSEMLAASPGVTVHALGGPGQPATLSLRGASADESLVLLDGIPLQGPGGGAIDLAMLPSLLLDRMVVSRGVLGAQFGAGALGGVLELQPRSVREKSAGVQASFGSFGTAQVAADGAVPIGQSGSGLLAVQADRTEGDFPYARQQTTGGELFGYTRANADARRGSALARVAAPLGPTELDLVLLGSAGDRGLPGPWTFPTHGRETDRSGLAGLRLQGTAGDAIWSTRAWARFDKIDLQAQFPYGDCTPPSCPTTDQRASAARGEGELDLPFGDHLVKGVLAVGQDRVHGSDIDLHARAVLSAALSDEWTPAAALSLHPAVRLDRVGDDGGVSPALAALWKTGPWQVRAGWGLSFRAPTFSELYLHQGGTGSNPDLKPERAWSVDGGLAWRSGRTTLSAGVFWSKYRDLIVYELKPSANEVTPYNVGSAHIAGVELQAVVPLPAGFIAEASYTFLHSVNDRPGAQESHELAYRPPHRLFARLARRGDRLEGYAETSFTSRMPRDQYGSAYLDPQFLVNAGAGIRAVGSVWLDLEAKNLLNDQTLEDVFQYPLPGFSIAVIARARL
jgi:iron complex outermembrane receptor protein